MFSKTLKQSSSFKDVHALFDNEPQQRLQIEKAFLHWHYTANTSDQRLPHNSDIVDLMFDGSKKSQVDGSYSRHQQKCKGFEHRVQEAVSLLDHKIRALKEQRYMLFFEANEQRQARIANALKESQNQRDEEFAQQLQAELNLENPRLTSWTKATSYVDKEKSKNRPQESSLNPEATTAFVKPRSMAEIKKETEELLEQRTCKICMDSEINMVFRNCGHMSTCEPCSEPLKECPICRAAIVEKIRFYMS